MNGKCLECGEDFVGRSDKKFCCDLCRTSYYNKIYRNKNANMAEVNRILSRNRHFLAGNYAKGITKIPLGHLVG
ncbi:MAG: hypothetical protein HUJ90_03665, partial [Bacteroidales bacterium]|nr:hypothetical protein [Bacteroidales bacterium]